MNVVNADNKPAHSGLQDGFVKNLLRPDIELSTPLHTASSGSECGCVHSQIHCNDIYSIKSGFSSRMISLIRQMVTRFGMSERLGHLTYGTQRNNQFLRSQFATEERNYSEKTSEEIDGEVRQIADELYERARTILTSRKADLERIAQELIQKETLDRHQLELLLAPPLKPAPA